MRVLIRFSLLCLLLVQGVNPFLSRESDSGKLERLVIGSASPIGLGPEIELKPGDTFEFRVGTLGLGYSFESLPVEVVWSIAPRTKGISIDQKTGRLTVAASVNQAASFKVRASVEGGRRLLTKSVRVFLPQGTPWVGRWEERAQLTCVDGKEAVPEKRILDFILKDDRSFSVTWLPFEVYRDYWGTYEYDPKTGKISLHVKGGNYIPPDLKLEGLLTIVDGKKLVLKGLRLGRPRDSKDPVRCGHVFTR